MGATTKNLARYVKEKGFNLSKLSRSTGIPYSALYASLCGSDRERSLRDDELIAVCAFLNVNPMEFAGKKGE